MHIKIQQWGNSAAIRLPAAVLKQLQLGVGSTLNLDTSGDALVLKPVKTTPRYTLEALMAECDLSAPEPEDMAQWRAMRPVGREL